MKVRVLGGSASTAIITAALAVVFTGSAHAEPKPFTIDSDRYLNGEILADHITHSILKQGYSKPLARNSSVAGLALRLMAGVSVAVHPTEIWGALDRWLTAQPFGSTTPEAFFSECLRISSGNVQDALMLAWDFLSVRWDRSVPDRNSRYEILKLLDITGELPLSAGATQPDPTKVSNRGDNYSAWYHLFGTALHSFIAVNTMVPGLQWRVSTEVNIRLEEKLFGSRFIDPLKRNEIDHAGAQFGRKLAENLNQFKTLPAFEGSGARWKDEYLYSDSEVYGEKWRLQPYQRAEDFLKPNSAGATEPRRAFDITLLFVQKRTTLSDSDFLDWVSKRPEIAEGEARDYYLQRLTHHILKDIQVDALSSQSRATYDQVWAALGSPSYYYPTQYLHAMEQIHQSLCDAVLRRIE